MAVITAVRGKLDMTDLGLDRDATFIASPNTIRLDYESGGYTDFDGTFGFGPSGKFTGRVDTITNVAGGQTTFTVTDVGANAGRLFALIQAGDIFGAEQYVLRGNDTITGGDRADTLMGFGGADVIDGGAGRDVIIGGAGRDRLTGGDGADRFVFLSIGDSEGKRGHLDQILDFSHAEGDKIDLSAIDANPDTPEDDSFYFSGSVGANPGETILFQTARGGWVLQAYAGVGFVVDFSIVIHSDAPLVASDFIL